MKIKGVFKEMVENNQFKNGDCGTGKIKKMGNLSMVSLKTVSDSREIVKVNVVESDNEKAVGKSIWILQSIDGLEKLPDLEISNETSSFGLN